MSRIPPISNPKQGDLASLFTKAEAWMGFMPNDGLVMAHKPDILTSFFALAKAIYAPGKIDSGLKRMIGHISSRAAGCMYCSAHTAFGADNNGVSEEKMKSIWEFNSSDLFDERERAALNVSLKGSMSPNQVDDDDFLELKKYFDNEAIVEIVSVIAMFGFLNRWNLIFNTEIEDVPEAAYQKINDKDGA